MAPVKVIVQGLPPGFRYNKELSQGKNENGKMELEDLFGLYGRVRCVYLWPETPYVIWRKWEGMVPDNFAVLEFEDAEDAYEACVTAARRRITFEKSVLTLTRMSEIVPPIEKLEDEILVKIFAMLDPANRMTIEKVCKRWRKLAPDCWRGKSLDLGGRVAESERCLDLTFEQYLKRCGQHLEYITCDVTSPKFIEFIPKYCPGLRSLQLWIYAKNLSSDSFVRMFRVLRNLSQLKIDYYPKLPGFSIVDHLPESMRKIYITYTGPNAHSFDLRKFYNLRSLSLRGFFNKLHVRGMNRTKLTYLDLKDSFVDESIIWQISDLGRLEVLNISKTKMTDEMLIKILKTNRGLEYLDISEISALSNDAIRQALWLPNLEVLKIEKLLVTLDIDFSMPSLRQLHCEGCQMLSNRKLTRLLKYAPKLRYLDIRNSSITIEFLEMAESALRRRLHFVPLTISMDRHKIPECSYSSYLTIVNSEL